MKVKVVLAEDGAVEADPVAEGVDEEGEELRKLRM